MENKFEKFDEKIMNEIRLINIQLTQYLPMLDIIDSMNEKSMFELLLCQHEDDHLGMLMDKLQLQRL